MPADGSPLSIEQLATYGVKPGMRPGSRDVVASWGTHGQGRMSSTRPYRRERAGPSTARQKARQRRRLTFLTVVIAAALTATAWAASAQASANPHDSSSNASTVAVKIAATGQTLQLPRPAWLRPRGRRRAARPRPRVNRPAASRCSTWIKPCAAAGIDPMLVQEGRHSPAAGRVAGGARDLERGATSGR